MSICNQILMNVIENNNIETTDIIDVFKQTFDANINVFHKNKKKQEKAIVKYEKVLKRLKTKANQILITILNGHIIQAKESIAQIDEEIEFAVKAKEIIADYDYEYEKQNNGFFVDSDYDFLNTTPPRTRNKYY
jgi:Na+/phosphate symporter